MSVWERAIIVVSDLAHDADRDGVRGAAWWLRLACRKLEDAEREEQREEELHPHGDMEEFGLRVLEILRLTELPANFDAPDKLGAIRNAATALGLLDEKEGKA